MEKLQKALQKAREQRGVEPATLAGTVSSEPTTSTPAATPRGWDALTEIQPDHTRLIRNRIMTMKAGTQATPFDILRTKVQLMMMKNGWTRLAITSPTPGCGKTTMACNLALGMTRQQDMRTILVECDLRRPSIAKVLDLSPPRDITALFSGEVGITDQALRIGHNLAICAAQRPAHDPTAVLLNQKTHDTLARIEQELSPDLMIFDLPPILVSDDTRAFLKDVDCALIVARAESTSVSQIDACEREIAEQTNVLGVVLNQCRHAGDTDYGYGKYGYGT
jgi:Mrp family chromosome partitioning ATPase